MKNIRNRIFGNWKSSLLGAILVLICFALVFFQKATFAEVSLFVIAGFGLMGVKDPKTFNLKMWAVIGGASLFFSSCSPQYRLKRLLKYHPELTVQQSVIFRDTIIIPKTDFDTVFKTDFDTVTIEKDNFKIELIRSDSLIYLYHTTPADTVYVEKTVLVDKIINPSTMKTPFEKIFGRVIALFFSVLLFVFGYRLIKSI